MGNAAQPVLGHFHRLLWNLLWEMLSRLQKPSQGTDGMCICLHFPDTHSRDVDVPPETEASTPILGDVQTHLGITGIRDRKMRTAPSLTVRTGVWRAIR